MPLVQREEVDEAFTAFIDGAVAWRVFFCRTTADVQQIIDDGDPYVIVWPIPGGRMYGPPLTAPEQVAELVYQTTCVGAREDQAQLVADAVRVVVIGRDVAGAFTTPLVVPQHKVLDREQHGEVGAAEDGAGGLADVHDRYLMKVSHA